MRTFAAVDLGASSGRVMVGRVHDKGLKLEETHRFANEPVRTRSLHWDILGLYREVLKGIEKAGPVDSIGIDSWAVDYGLLDAGGALLGNPVHYRDSRTDNVRLDISDEQLYEINGLQKLPFNTIYQLAAAQETPQFAMARQMLLIPDLLAYWLTGEIGAEYTNASTTGLLDVRTREWSAPLTSGLGLSLPPIRRPGETIGEYEKAKVVAVGSHDTASAVVGVPADGENFAYISCGTWSLVGLELTHPVLGPESRKANFTNEGGVDGTIRYLRNVMGLWPLQECMREWGSPDIGDLLRQASREKPVLIDIDDPAFLPPGNMAERVARAAGLPADTSPARLTRCIVDSLALAHKKAVEQAQELSGRHVDAVHIVGGGARNELLCQLTADACGLPVLAGPVEATALGNLLVQARAAGVIEGDLAALRSVLRDTQQVVRYNPAGR
ncbi:carbohydrate kinase [Paractinoplanes abujensis]|uniref:Rhamnulokinase n=1 Tax=Paractinoplanes abujensis TaxID=882441 RepID=A0A7W7CVU7_9ACTN|nr:rhamnulokinase family protein [Actinoplanes abujensis]MBB4695581.1 rhamnulokinase [Actinoplanes abujensis]GID23165.1 carbohydrate kinase [Actinoplanes abujensis]